MVRLECKDGAHYKFWEAEVKAASLVVHFGRIGTEGQVKAKKLPSPAAAQAELEKLIREKLCTVRSRVPRAARGRARRALGLRAQPLRGAEDPSARGVHPDSNELTMVPAALLGIRKDDQAEVYGVSTPAKGEPFLWALCDYELRRVSWAAVLALPRVAATT
jgi:predicted DNA-binding WGR domain protein